MKLTILPKVFLGLVALVALLAMVPANAARPAHAGKPVPSGTIAIAAGYTPALGEDLLFDYTVADLPGNANPRIQVLCYQAEALVYGEAGPAEQTFLLGGGASDWLTNGGPADCVATLYYWDFHPVQTFHALAEIAFDAGG